LYLYYFIKNNNNNNNNNNNKWNEMKWNEMKWNERFLLIKVYLGELYLKIVNPNSDREKILETAKV